MNCLYLKLVRDQAICLSWRKYNIQGILNKVPSSVIVFSQANVFYQKFTYCSDVQHLKNLVVLL